MNGALAVCGREVLWKGGFVDGRFLFGSVSAPFFLGKAGQAGSGGEFRAVHVCAQASHLSFLCSENDSHFFRISSKQHSGPHVRPKAQARPEPPQKESKATPQ